jgi:tripartite-type tricarboxylate transporter receptor subunit TctC
LGKNLGQSVIIDNKAGAAGALAAKDVATASADGYTLLNVDMGTYTLNPHLYAKLPYDPRRDFKMVAPLVTLPMVLYVPASMPVSNVQEFVKFVKAQPAGSVNFASSGMGNPVHLTMELFMRQAGLTMTHVPYRGSPAAMADLIGGQVQALFNDPNTGHAAREVREAQGPRSCHAASHRGAARCSDDGRAGVHCRLARLGQCRRARGNAAARDRTAQRRPQRHHAVAGRGVSDGSHGILDQREGRTVSRRTTSHASNLTR